MPKPDATVISELISEYIDGHSLQQGFYTEPAIYRAELQTVFSNHWLFAGHASQISSVGDYFLVDVGDDSVIVIRTANNEIKAHANVCRHRGSRICLEQHGSAKRLTCPYHAWSYNLDGNLVSARYMPPDFKPSENGLKSINLEVVHGLIFICLDESPPSLDELHDDLDDLLALFGVADMQLAEQKTYRIPANWKLAVENYQECYHCAPSHKEFAKVHAMGKSPDAFQKAKIDYWRLHVGNEKFKEFNRYFDLANDGQEGYQYDRNPLVGTSVSGSQNGKAVAPLLGQLTSYDGGASELMIGPLSFFLIYDDHILGYRFLPVSQDECVCDVFWFVNASAVSERDYRLDELTWLWDITTQADKQIIVNNAKGVASKYYAPGHLSEMEAFQQNFINWYLKTLSQAV